ncbi:MAG: FAD-dependent oxidoreductase [Spirochaetota bacterium]
MSEDDKTLTKASPEYLRILSHQLKSPINAIQFLLDTISKGYAGEVSLKTLQFIEKAKVRTAEAKDMITDLLDYQLYSRDQAAIQEEYDLSELLASLLGQYATPVSEKGISLRPEIPKATKMIVLGDVKGMEHAIRNVVENAIKYTPPAGTVVIAVSFDEAGKKGVIKISDTGCGIPADEIGRIFEPFYRLTKHKSSIAGTGLGLTIVKKVIENHKGTISVESTENKGTTFTINLPYVRLERSGSVERAKKKIVIIGGVTAGPKAAARLRRLDEQMDITIIEKSEFLSYSGCGLPSFISGKVRSAKELMSTADDTVRNVQFFESIKNINILNNTLVHEIDRVHKRVKIEDLTNGAVSHVQYDILILATGALPYIPDIPGIREKGIFTLRSLEDANAIKEHLQGREAQDLFIIGGGLIGISTAESLIETGARITILEKKEYILNTLLDKEIALKVQNELGKRGIKIITGVLIREIRKEQTRLLLETEKGTFTSDLIILSTGVVPNSLLAERAGFELGESGGIKVNEYLQTTDENIYAVGDCAESINLTTMRHEYWPLGSVSTKMGRIAADNICGRKTGFKGSIGTALFKIMDVNIGRTGLTLKTALDSGFEAASVTVSGLDRAHYSEHSGCLILNVIADTKTRRILGAQGYGRGDVSGKIGILAESITCGLTLEEIFKLDLGYAPAFNNPIDIAQMACTVLSNKIEGLVQTISLKDFEKEREQLNIVSVCPLSTYLENSIPGSINIPLENIRKEELPYDKKSKIVLYSRTSAGAYEAYRFLVTRGYTNLFVLEGGYVYWMR